jgi:hypothetical protein
MTISKQRSLFDSKWGYYYWCSGLISFYFGRTWFHIQYKKLY